MEAALYIIAFISSSIYGINIMADCSLENRPLSTHIGYGVISIISSYYINFTVCVIFCIIVILYTILILFCYLDKTKESKNREYDV